MSVQTSYKVILSYNGTHYSGWQNQKGKTNTIQHQVESVIAKIVNYQDFKVIGASRTDTGVHALGQVLKITLPRLIDVQKLKAGMNSKLPVDIKVLDIQTIANTFNVNRDSKAKEYHYYFCFTQPNAIVAPSVHFIPHKLNLSLMKRGCKLICGEHNFEGLSTSGARMPNPIREITHCSIQKTTLGTFGDEIFYLKISSSGFLKYMVRFIMDTLIRVGREEVSLDQLTRSLSTGSGISGKKRAPAKGLHLIRIDY